MDKKVVLELNHWQELEKEHQRIVRTFTVPFRDRRSRGVSHPVYDFLFTYYAFPPARLEQWHPGINVILYSGGDYGRFSSDKRYDCLDNRISLKPALLTQTLQRRLLWVVKLLENIKKSIPRFGCYALHEWAMVYKLSEERRYSGYPLRVTPEVIQNVIEKHQLRCTHFDAYRFFSPKARPQNQYILQSDSRMEFEQGGCIHASMDLYKWAFLFSPWVGSSLLLECFLLAIRARELDMRSSPYELSSLGFEPIPIETESGRQTFISMQRELAIEASGVREKLISLLTILCEDIKLR
jgi:hypothetical protein